MPYYATLTWGSSMVLHIDCIDGFYYFYGIFFYLNGFSLVYCIICVPCENGGTPKSALFTSIINPNF